MVSPEILQIALTLAGAFAFYIRVQGQIDKAKSDAEVRETKLTSEALSRESKIKSETQEMKSQLESEAERIQQESQRIVNETTVQLRDMIVAQSKQSIDDGRRYADAMAKLAGAIEQLHAAELQAKDTQNEKMKLEQTVIDLTSNMEKLENRICVLEQDNEEERNKRLAAEERAIMAEERAEIAEAKMIPVRSDKIETQELPNTI